MSDRDPWLTEREAARELRVSVTTLRAERGDGKLKFIQLRKRIFYPLSELEAYKASLICQNDSASGSTPQAGAGTSHGPRRTADRAESRQDRRIGELLNRSARELS